jgi:hypothetical protein
MSPPSNRSQLDHPAIRSLLRTGIHGMVRLTQSMQSLTNALRWLRLRHFWLKPRPGDIYIATSPKAGTTWLQMIVYQLVTQGRGEFEHILQVSPFLEQLSDKRDAERLLDSLPSPRILKTHLLYGELNPPADSRVIYVTRNASDTLRSLYHHECLVEGFHLDFESFFREVMDGGDSWFSHLESWWPHRNDPNVLHVRYEDLVADLEGGLRRIATFCGLTLDESRMGELMEKCGFQYMKQHNDRFDFRMTFYDRGGTGGGFIREGGVGKGRAKLSAEQQAELDGKVRRFREKLGISPSEL